MARNDQMRKEIQDLKLWPCVISNMITNYAVSSTLEKAARFFQECCDERIVYSNVGVITIRFLTGQDYIVGRGQDTRLSVDEILSGQDYLLIVTINQFWKEFSLRNFVEFLDYPKQFAFHLPDLPHLPQYFESLRDNVVHILKSCHDW